MKNLLYLCSRFTASLSVSGGLQAIAELMQLEQELFGMQNEPMNMALRRYAGMALTNLTYGDVVNKVNENKTEILYRAKELCDILY